jgi:hypothetical protein
MSDMYCYRKYTSVTAVTKNKLAWYFHYFIKLLLNPILFYINRAHPGGNFREK